MLFKRQKRFDENKKILRKANDKNRKKLGLWGPATTKEKQAYLPEVVDILEELKLISIEELWNW